MAMITETSSTIAEPRVVGVPTKAPFSLADLPLRRFTVDEYYRLARTGILGPDEHLELIQGVIVKMAAKGGPHVTSCTNTRDTFLDKFGHSVLVREEKPIDLGGTEPEPDVVVARGKARDYVQHHPRPADISLLVEVADTSLEYDLNVKVPLYAAAGIIEYWIVDLENSRLEVYRDPVPANDTHPAQYRVHITFFPGDVVSPLSFPQARIAVSDLLP